MTATPCDNPGCNSPASIISQDGVWCGEHAVCSIRGCDQRGVHDVGPLKLCDVHRELVAMADALTEGAAPCGS